MSSTSPPGDASLPAHSSSSLSIDSSDTAPVLPPLNLSFHSTSELDLGGVHGSSPPPSAGDVSNTGPDTEPGVIKSTMSFSDASILPPITNLHTTHSSNSSSPPISDLRSIPIPVPVTSTTAHGTNPQINPTRTFVMVPSKSMTSDLGAEQGNGADSARIDIDSLPPEVTKADLFIAPDGSFVQTSSALAARELKKCYDKILRVGHRDQVVRSPYAITAVEDETGAKVFRISRRDDDSAPLPSDHPISQPQVQTQPVTTTTATTSSRRKARLSVQDFLPSGMFKPNNNSSNAAAAGSTNSNQTQSGSNISSSPVTNSGPSSPPPITRRKLRKTRSNSDLHSRVTLSPSNSTDTHSQAPSQHHGSRYTYGYDTYSVFPTFEIRDELTAGADAFSQVLGWASELATETGAIASSSRRKGKSISGAMKGLPILIGNADDGRILANTHDEVGSTTISAPETLPTSRSRSSSAAGLASVQNATTARRPSVSTSAALSNIGVVSNGVGNSSNVPFNNYTFGEPWRLTSPFGENVRYTTPLRGSNGNLGLDSDSIVVAESSPSLMEDSLSQPSQLRELREMQSFESGLTARVGDIGVGSGQERSTASFGPDVAFEAASSELDPDTPKFAKEDMKDSSHVSLGNPSVPFNSNTWLHFSTRVFDVIQTYKGLPLPSALSSAPPTGATIKMTSTESPNPKDDPRFVIWGELHGDSGDTGGASRDDASMSVSMSGGSQAESNTQSSHTHSTSSAAPLPPRKRSNARQPDPLSSANTEAIPRTVIIAATVERWIAQLTSELDYDELLNFLLTYRTYITSIDLCHLLICRFHWALEKSTSKQDEMVRRIIRVRTFIAIRYWLLTFFREDFLPNFALCTLFTAWLNSLFRDLSTRGDRGGDALSIVRKLRKVVRECKAAHSRRGTDTAANSTALITDDSDVDLDFSSVHNVRGPLSSFDNVSEMGTISSSTGTDVGISFDGAAKFGVYPTLGAKTGPATLAALAASHVPFTSPDSLLLSQPLSKTILDHVKSPKPGTDAPLAQAAGIGTLPLPSRSGAPYHSSAISRAFVNTIGRLGRWKRVLNVRSSAAVGGSSYAANMALGYVPQIEVRNLGGSHSLPAESSSSSASGVTADARIGVGREMANSAEELLHVKGGVEEYLKMLKLGPAKSEAERNASGATAPFSSKEGFLTPESNNAEVFDGDTMSNNNASTADNHEDGDNYPYPARPPGLDIPPSIIASTSESFSDSDESSTRSVMDSNSIPPAFDGRFVTDKQTTVENVIDPAHASAISNDPEQGEPRETNEEPSQGANATQLKNGWAPDIISLDNYDLSTSESDLSSVDDQGRVGGDAGVGVGIRKGKTARRLPLRREFQFVRGSGGSVSSLGIRSRSSFVLSIRSRSRSRERESERIDSVTSAATRKRSRGDGSPASSTHRSSHSSSLSSSQRTTSQTGTSHMGGYTPHFQQWQIELISDDEEEAGDAEAALRRLEGQIDVERQREKDMKVGRWLKTARAKGPDGIDFSAEGSRRRRVGERKYSISAESVGSMQSGNSLSVGSVGYKDEEEGDSSVNLNPVAPTPTNAGYEGGPNVQERDRSGSVSSMASISSSSGYVKSSASASTGANSAYVRTSTIATHAARHPTVLSSNRADASINSNKTFKPPSVSASVPTSGHAPSASLLGPGSTMPYAYRSFILLHRSELLAQQFMIIEADLFKKIKFEEIISHQWGQAIEDVNVRDWVSFVKERARLKNTGASSGGAGGGSSDSNGETHFHSTSMIHTATHYKLSSILALRARFDLVVNFIASEVVLTHPMERVILIEKIIRIAWKMYLHNNFNTLVAIVSGLQTRWVNKAMGKKWNKVGMWEQRIFEDLKRFASREGEFKYIRNATAALIDQRPLGSGTEGGTINSPSVTGSSFDRDKEKEHSSPQGHSHQHRQPYCLPFLGAYLAQLYAYEKLPDFIDPTAPTEPVLIDISTGTLSPPSHAEVFFNLQPLPEDIALEPLINVHKQRLIAGVIKAFVGAQHLAASVPFGVDEKSYHKCFRIRSLETEVLQSLLGREAG